MMKTSMEGLETGMLILFPNFWWLEVSLDLLKSVEESHVQYNSLKLHRWQELGFYSF